MAGMTYTVRIDKLPRLTYRNLDKAREAARVADRAYPGRVRLVRTGTGRLPFGVPQKSPLRCMCRGKGSMIDHRDALVQCPHHTESARPAITPSVLGSASVADACIDAIVSHGPEEGAFFAWACGYSLDAIEDMIDRAEQWAAT